MWRKKLGSMDLTPRENTLHRKLLLFVSPTEAECFWCSCLRNSAIWLLAALCKLSQPAFKIFATQIALNWHRVVLTPFPDLITNACPCFFPQDLRNTSWAHKSIAAKVMGSHALSTVSTRLLWWWCHPVFLPTPPKFSWNKLNVILP